MSFQVGVSSSDTIDVTIADIRTTALGDGTNTLSDDGSGSPASIGTAAKAAGAVDIIDGALSQISEGRADVGALISRFEFAAANVATTIENLDSARSTLLDVDMAAEMSNFSSKQVLVQASVAMLAQANQMPQQLLRLLN
jgi:flagellin